MVINNKVMHPISRCNNSSSLLSLPMVDKTKWLRSSLLSSNSNSSKTLVSTTLSSLLLASRIIVAISVCASRRWTCSVSARETLE